jgi:DNA polymerase
VSTLYLDLETYSDVPIAYGTHAYAEKAEVLLCAYAFDDEDVAVLDLTDGASLGNIQMLIDTCDDIVIHNSAFDRTVLRHQGVCVPLERISDTMVQAMSHSLPGSLDALCGILGVDSDKAKDKNGKKLIHLFTKPRPKSQKLRRATRVTHPDEWAQFIEYARLDVVAMRDVHRRLPRWNTDGSERGLWRVDQTINDRGVAVDVDLARSALRAFERSARSLTARSTKITEGAVGSLTQRAKLLEYMDKAHGFRPADLTKGTVSAFLKGTAVELDPEVRELLEIRQQASATSPAKYKVLLNASSSDGRLRGTLQFCGAIRTGRWGGRLFQPQNLPRPTLKGEDIDFGIEAMKADCEDLLYSNVSELCSSAVRGCLIAPPGRKLVVSDLSNIEGRVLAWLAGEVWKTKAFADYDKGSGHDLYVLAYAKSFGLTPEEVIDNKKNGDGSMRQIGKVMELACGYQGSVGAFATMGAIYGVDLPEDEILLIVKAWRKAHRNVVSFWYDVDAAAKTAIAKPGTRVVVRDLSFGYSDGWLRIRLPSGRYLCYPDAQTQDDGQIAYSGTNQYTRKWETLRTYGGKLVENIVQAVARDVLAHGMLAAEAEGYEVVLHVHDELITETPDDERYSVDELSSIMATNPGWSLGLPLAAAGFETKRYRKD